MSILLAKKLCIQTKKKLIVCQVRISLSLTIKNDAIKTKHNEIALCTLCILPFLLISSTRHRKLLRVSKPLVLLIIKNAYNALLHHHATARNAPENVPFV